MSASRMTYWKFQARSALTRLGVWGQLERWRLHWRYRCRQAHETDFAFFGRFDGMDGLFVDVGANLGQSAVSFRLANRSCKILSFEPNPEMALALAAVGRFLGSGFDYRMAGLGAKSERKRLYLPVVKGVPFTQCATFCRERFEGPEMGDFLYQYTRTRKYSVEERALEIVRFDELGIDPTFIKMDVEGFEAEVLTGMAETLRRCKSLVMTEGNGAKDVLAQLGYEMFLHEPKTNVLRPCREAEGGLNFFFVHSERIGELRQLGAIAVR